MAERKIKRALISVYDKTGIVDFARSLVDEFGIEIVSTGGTAALLKENGVPVTLVEEITGFPEMMDGRVKTLHPKIHAGILADRDNPEHMRQLEEQGIKPIDMVVVNLYPFAKTVADPECTFEQAIEMIDIGGPCMLRAAAKNHKHVVAVACEVNGEFVRRALLGSEDWDEVRRMCAEDAFDRTRSYDQQIVAWFQSRDSDTWSTYSQFLELLASEELRYGENPHTQGVVRSYFGESKTGTLLSAEVPYPTGKMSFNNYVDADSALELCKELTRETGSAKILFAQTKTHGQTHPQAETDHEAAEAKRFGPIAREVLTRRKLPHWQIPGATYWVTFRSAVGELSPTERDMVMSAIRHWDGEKLNLHAAAVMPDHVHMLFTPREVPGQGNEQFNLSALLQSIEAHTGRQISKHRNGVKQVWVRESFDRWIRSESDFIEKYRYIANNPVKEGLADRPEDYKWWYGVEAMRGDPQFETTSDSDEARESRLENLPSFPISHKENLCAPPVCVFIKHTNACGVGISGDRVEAYKNAYLGDPNAAMGGILACNFEIDSEFAQGVMETYSRWGKKAGAGGFFVEVWIAPSFDESAVEVIRTTKKWGERVRLLSVGDMNESPNINQLEYKSITGGMLVQTRDLVGLNEDQWKVVSKREPTDREMDDLRLAWLICKHTKSNAITICRDNMLIGNGAGQMSRVMSCRIAKWMAAENGHKNQLPGSVAASDAFFPFADGPTILMDAGVTAIIQPGGSKRDEDTIKACDERGVALIFTGTRHFKH